MLKTGELVLEEDNKMTKGIKNASIVKKVEFAFWPRKISKVKYDQHGAWIVPTGRIAILRKVIYCFGYFEKWYELPGGE